MLANDYSAGEGPGIYSNPARHSVCVNEIMIVNCEGSNTTFSGCAHRIDSGEMPQKRIDDSYQHLPPSVRPLLRWARRRGHVI
jgi:hypothetical protein